MRKNPRANLILIIASLSLISIAISLSTEDPKDENPISELYYNVTSSYMKSVIADLAKIADSYVFSDILKNPPAPYNDSKYDIVSELEKINTEEEKPFYEFYREIKKVFANSKDSTLSFNGGDINLESKINFGNYRFCLPFEFYLDYQNDDEIKLYIKEYPECSKFYDEEKRKEIKAVENISLEFIKFKNPNSQFSFILENIKNEYLGHIPMLPEEINKIELNFTNHTITLNTHFHIIKNSDELFNQKEESTKKEDIQVNSEYMNNEEIKWDTQTTKGEIKCRVDDKNQLNVVILNKLTLENSNDINIIIDNCAINFYKNDYRILIITSQNLGGNNEISYIFTQMIQPKIDVKFNFAMKQTELNDEIYKLNKNNILNAKTCSIFETLEDFKEPISDDYEDNIKHNRTKLFSMVARRLVKELKRNRETIQGLKNKKPTDILILTDTLSSGAASNFIKTLHNNGGAIIASYGGNPKLNKDDIKNLDSSLDSDNYITYSINAIYKSLSDKGFILESIPFAESFENLEGNDYPMAYKINKVDEVTNIYHKYDDSYYSEFIETAKNIFKKYNENKECNKNNLNLVYEDFKCTFENDIYAHGGYSCGSDGKWSNICKKYFCNIGYYYNRY